MSMFLIHFSFFYLLLQKKGRFLSILYTSVYDILYQVFLFYVMSLFQIYIWNVLCILVCIMYFNTGHHGRTALSEWFTMYKYICNKKFMNFLDLGLHLLTWTNCNPCMDMYLYQVYSVGWNNFQQISTVQLLTLENE